MKLIEIGTQTTKNHLVRFTDDENREWFINIIEDNGKFKDAEPATICKKEFDMLSPLVKNKLVAFAHNHVRTGRRIKNYWVNENVECTVILNKILKEKYFEYENMVNKHFLTYFKKRKSLEKLEDCKEYYLKFLIDDTIKIIKDYHYPEELENFVLCVLHYFKNRKNEV